jgi:hypothetical protein
MTESVKYTEEEADAGSLLTLLAEYRKKRPLSPEEANWIMRCCTRAEVLESLRKKLWGTA